MKKKSVVGLVTLCVAILFSALIFWGFKSTAVHHKGPEPVIRPVKTLVLSETVLSETRTFPGLVHPASETDLTFRVGGPLIALDIRIGQRVEKGEVLARIDSRDFEISVKRLEAALGEARANLKAMKRGARAEDIAALEANLKAARSRMIEAKNNYERLEKLIDDMAVSRSQYDSARAAWDTAASSVEAASQELKKARKGARAEEIEAAEAGIRKLDVDLKAAENAMADTVLKAPFSGVVNRKHVENFENIKAGDPILSLLDFSSVEVATAIPEDLIIRRSSFGEIFCTIEAYPGRRFGATLKEVSRKTDSANQSYPVTAVLKLPGDVVVEPGMAATLSFSLRDPGKADTGFFLPAGSVFADAEGHSCVWLIDPKSMQVVKTRITIGDLNGENVHVLSGLKAGERVVTAGARFLRDNQKVRILRQDRKSAS